MPREWEMWVCRCGSSALGGPEEVVHFNNQCPGRRDEGLIERVVLVPRDESIDFLGTDQLLLVA
jgi:hypothetical protein